MPNLLDVQGVEVRFGGVQALRPLDIELDEQSGVVAVIGANGAGKTTLVNVLTGVVKPTAGRVLWRGKDITRWQVQRRTRLGMYRTFQKTGVFDSLTPRQHLSLALDREGEVASAEEWLGRFDLLRLQHVRAALLSHVERRVLEILVVLCSEPRLVLLDEPTSGMDAQQIQRVREAIEEIRGHSPVLLVEHDIEFVLSIADYVLVMERGRVIARGVVQDILHNRAVARTYLGRFADA